MLQTDNTIISLNKKATGSITAYYPLRTVEEYVVEYPKGATINCCLMDTNLGKNVYHGETHFAYLENEKVR